MIISALFIIGIGLISLKALFITLLTKLFFDGCLAGQDNIKRPSMSWFIFDANALIVVKVADLL